MLALAAEAGELVAIFQWLSPDESEHVMADRSRAERVHDEMADIFAHLLRLADILDVGLEGALGEKMIKNAQTYAAETAWGNARKSTDLP